MSRYDGDNYESDESQMALFRANVDRASRGKRGQAFFLEFEQILLAMPNKRLASGVIADESGEVCAIGAYARAKNPETLTNYIDKGYESFSLWDTATLGAKCGMAKCLAWEVAYVNDETFEKCTPEERHAKMLAWVRTQIVAEQLKVVTA